MTRILHRLKPRELMLALAVALLSLGFLGYSAWILPAYDAWTAARADAVAKRVEKDKLAGFLEIRDPVTERYVALDPAVFQDTSDQITLSHYLRRVEELARLPGLNIVNAKPQPVEDLGTHRRFPIRLSVSGPLPEVSRFVTRLLNDSDVTGLGGFSLRGTQGGRFVECSLSVWMVRLEPLDDGGAGASAGASTVAFRGGER